MKKYKIGIVLLAVGICFFSIPCFAADYSGILAGSYYAPESISIGNATVENTAGATVTSGTSIIVSPPFHAKPGSYFNARIGENPLDVVGTDANSDGIRDDIKAFIDQTYAGSQKTREGLYQYSRVLQDRMEAPNTKTAIMQNANNISRSIECLMYIRPNDAHAILIEIKARMFNTYARTITYLNSQQHLAGETFSSNNPDDWDDSCDFYPDSMPN